MSNPIPESSITLGPPMLDPTPGTFFLATAEKNNETSKLEL
jgi:hypothetical protein